MQGYDLELTKAIEKIKDMNAQTVLIQLPDGLKPQAKEIIDTIQAEVDARIEIWADSCYGACDIPNVSNYDLLIQWGHSEWL